MASDSQLYFTSTEIPLMGLLANGKKGRAIIASGSPAIKITDRVTVTISSTKVKPAWRRRMVPA